MHFDARTPKPRYAFLAPSTLPPRRDFTACNRHIIAAASAAAITRFAFHPYRGASRSAACLWDGEASAGCGLAKPAREDVQQGGPRRGPHGAEMASTATSKEPRDCEPGAASAAGLGRGRGEAVKRRDEGTASDLTLTLIEG
ncbi:hypothetical protein [Pectobacterium brasiliense]|uniref:hypothetical protein n=1 Tax=Pectobacterium brasiliense TaxID=180957 RepID=UPI001CF266AD|nr:hypothetical protein [Pectobacterium brasiliense]MCA6983363.1 hypothetical protein [Pectobacterium brasiliense]MCH4992915.1 hypothetical protein [Pectobacterium brasiliense]